MMPTVEATTGIYYATLALAIVTTVLVGATLWYAKATNGILKEMRKQREEAAKDALLIAKAMLATLGVPIHRTAAEDAIKEREPEKAANDEAIIEEREASKKRERAQRSTGLRLESEERARIGRELSTAAEEGDGK